MPGFAARIVEVLRTILIRVNNSLLYSVLCSLRTNYQSIAIRIIPTHGYSMPSMSANVD